MVHGQAKHKRKQMVTVGLLLALLGGGVLIWGAFQGRDEALSSQDRKPPKPVLLYTKTSCPYCLRAKRLLWQKGVSFTELDLNFQPEMRQEMLERSHGRQTVPQIFIGELHVGGLDDLEALENQGRLDALLSDHVSQL